MARTWRRSVLVATRAIGTERRRPNTHATRTHNTARAHASSFFLHSLFSRLAAPLLPLRRAHAAPALLIGAHTTTQQKWRASGGRWRCCWRWAPAWVRARASLRALCARPDRPQTLSQRHVALARTWRRASHCAGPARGAPFGVGGVRAHCCRGASPPHTHAQSLQARPPPASRRSRCPSPAARATRCSFATRFSSKRTSRLVLGRGANRIAFLLRVCHPAQGADALTGTAHAKRVALLLLGHAAARRRRALCACAGDATQQWLTCPPRPPSPLSLRTSRTFRRRP